jgi:carbonic anhydrase
MFNDRVAYANVENSLEEILTRSEIVKEMFAKGEIGLVGGVYNIDNGKVDFFKNLTKKDRQKTASKIKETA